MVGLVMEEERLIPIERYMEGYNKGRIIVEWRKLVIKRKQEWDIGDRIIQQRKIKSRRLIFTYMRSVVQ